MLESAVELLVYLSKLALTNYRNFRSLELDLPQGLVFIVGANGQGKTNLLEAVYFLAISKSYRTNVERELVHWSAQRSPEAVGTVAEQTIVSGQVELAGAQLRVIVGLRVMPDVGASGALVKKQVRVNGVATTAAGLVGHVNAVLFTAMDIELVIGSPPQRRRFLDILISQVDRAYLRTLQRYQKVLIQRNHLLRSIREGRSGQEEMDFWDGELVKEGTVLVVRRDEVLRRLAPLAVKEYAGLVDQEDLVVEYHPSVGAEDLAETLAEQRPTEIRAGMTLSGPHRDNLGLFMNGKPATTYTSRGQARTIALALRLAEAQYLLEERRDGPVLLLDDVLSELDPYRRRRVLEEAGTYQQALITVADVALIEGSPVRPSAVLMVKDGKVEPWVRGVPLMGNSDDTG